MLLCLLSKEEGVEQQSYDAVCTQNFGNEPNLHSRYD